MSRNYDKEMRAARKRIEGMDDVDGSCVEALPLDLALRTIMCAVECGINNGRWDTIADAQVMLSQLEFSVRPADSKAGGFYLMEKST